MSRCLRDQTFLLLCEGEEAGDARSHLNTCVACRARYRQFVRDLEVIDGVLRDSPPRHPASSQARVFRTRWLPIAACALVMIVIGGGLWWQRASAPVLSPSNRNEDILQFLEKEIAPALFATADVYTTTVSSSVSPAAYVEAAVQGEWPCERYHAFTDPQCEIHPFPLLIGGQ